MRNSAHGTITQLSLLAIIFVAFALRAFRLGDQELRGDEAFGYFFSLRSYGSILRDTLRLHEPHPVASYFLQKAWIGLAGHTEFALRFISTWFGVLAVALIYWLGRQLMLPVSTATLATMLLAISPYAVWHSQDARMYTISLAFTLASTGLAIRVWQGRGCMAGYLYVLVSWLALHTHYFAAFVILAQNVFAVGVALQRDQRQRFNQWLRLQILLGLLYLPWLVLARGILVSYQGTGDSPPIGVMLHRSLSAFAVGETLPAEPRVIFTWLAAALSLCGAWRLASTHPHSQRALGLLTLYLAIPLLATWAGARSRPIFNERYLIAAVPPFYLLIAAAIGNNGGRKRSPYFLSFAPRLLSFAAFSILLFGDVASLYRYYADPAYSKTLGWRELAAALDRLSAGMPAEMVRLVDNRPDPTLWYYYTGPVPHGTLPPAAYDREGAKQEVAAWVQSGVQRVVLAMKTSKGWDEDGIAQAVLSERFALIAEMPVGVWTVQVYVRPPQEMTPIHVAFANGLTLVEASVQPSRLAPGGVLAVHLRWRGTANALRGSEKIFLHLVDADGALVAQTDRPFGVTELQMSTVSYGILLPNILPPGEYRLLVGLYDPAKEGSPRWLTVTGADFVELGLVHTG
ncbi:MAG: glycosyltransferase family 39 protein [Anaerolineae bacterium]|nr:glycosyltransferase family 39 protein [Anaerolineae bacterium]